jgi:hypothetical protein
VRIAHCRGVADNSGERDMDDLDSTEDKFEAI